MSNTTDHNRMKISELQVLRAIALGGQNIVLKCITLLVGNGRGKNPLLTI